MRKPKVIITYNNNDITQNISKYIESVTYTDYEKGQCDELSITLNDFDKFFQNDWRPLKGDKISARIGYDNAELLNCGTFTIEEPEFISSDDGDKFTIRGLAASINEKIRENHSKSYRNKTLIAIAKEIAAKHGYSVAGLAGSITIPYEAQYEENDISFLNRLATKYGYIFKLTDNVISFIPENNLLNQGTLFSVKRTNLSHISVRDCGAKTYNACCAKYLNPKTGKLVSYIARSSRNDVKAETLYLKDKFATREQAKIAAEAGLKNGSKNIEGNMELLKGQTKAIAGVNFMLELNNSFDGKYHITQSAHTITSEGYTVNVEFTKC